MFNKVILVGNLTRDVELRYLPSGAALARLNLATNRRYKKQDGTQAEEVCFIDVNLFGRTAEVANQYLKKGSQVLIEGRLVLESWTDNTGVDKALKKKITIMGQGIIIITKSMRSLLIQHLLHQRHNRCKKSPNSQ